MLAYRAAAGVQQDNQVPEVFLGSYCAPRLHDELGSFCHVEPLYTVMVREVGVEMSAELLTSLGGCRADVALYGRQTPRAVVEFKIIDEGRRAGGLVADRRKIEKLTSRCAINGQLAALVCERADGTTLSQAMSEIEAVVGCRFAPGEEQTAPNGWKWLIACARLPMISSSST